MGIAACAMWRSSIASDGAQSSELNGIPIQNGEQYPNMRISEIHQVAGVLQLALPNMTSISTAIGPTSPLNSRSA